MPLEKFARQWERFDPIASDSSIKSKGSSVNLKSSTQTIHARLEQTGSQQAKIDRLENQQAKLIEEIQQLRALVDSKAD